MAFLSNPTVIVRTPVAASVVPETMAPSLPTNLTSLAFLTSAEYAVSVAAPSVPVVLLEDTTQPI